MRREAPFAKKLSCAIMVAEGEHRLQAQSRWESWEEGAKKSDGRLKEMGVIIDGL